MFDIWTNVCFLFNSSVEINDDSKVKLKTIICLQRNMENGGRIVVYRKLNAFFKKQNACFIKHCYFQSTHFRFIKQNIHLIHMRSSCATTTHSSLLFLHKSYARITTKDSTELSFGLDQLVFAFTLFTSTQLHVIYVTVSLDVCVSFHRLAFTISF